VDLAILDLGLPDGSGPELVADFRAANPRRVQALALSATDERAEMAWAVELGVAGLLPKPASVDEVLDALRRLRAGEAILPLEAVVALFRLAGARKEVEHEARWSLESLTERERELLSLLAEGLDPEEIADRLHISTKMERDHVATILLKLGVHSRLQAVVFAARYGAGAALSD
jgi:DNA-binding NarL/FixJ family response regulator